MALSEMVQVGDKVQERNGNVWIVLELSGNIAHYNRRYWSDAANKYHETDSFIARFGGKYGQPITYNKFMTLVDPSTPHSGYEVDIPALKAEHERLLQLTQDLWKTA